MSGSGKGVQIGDRYVSLVHIYILSVILLLALIGAIILTADNYQEVRVINRVRQKNNKYSSIFHPILNFAGLGPRILYFYKVLFKYISYIFKNYKYYFYYFYYIYYTINSIIYKMIIRSPFNSYYVFPITTSVGEDGGVQRNKNKLYNLFILNDRSLFLALVLNIPAKLKS